MLSRRRALLAGSDLPSPSALSSPCLCACPQVKPTHVLNAAGVTGRPNVDWCAAGSAWIFSSSTTSTTSSQAPCTKRSVLPHGLCTHPAGCQRSTMPHTDPPATPPTPTCRCETHKVETIRANVIGCLNLADVCLQNGIHMTYYGTGAAGSQGGALPLLVDTRPAGARPAASTACPLHPLRVPTCPADPATRPADPAPCLTLFPGCIFHYDDGKFKQGNGVGFQVRARQLHPRGQAA